LVKNTFYLSFIILFLVGVSLVANAILNETSVVDNIVLNNVKDFISALTFWSIVIHIAITLILALAFSEIKEYFGGDTFYSFLLGKYHTPNQETRIFMFLDMRSSTTIAERLGHECYFELIKKYYSDMTQTIQQTSGAIYQYVGDEIVVSWIEKKGLNDNNCIECFREISETIDEHKE
jgi:adenylate cyclase